MYSQTQLTQKQAQVLEFLSEFRHKEGTAPTYREIAGYFGFKSTKAASDHVRALVKKGYVRLHEKRSRGIELVFPQETSSQNSISIPILGDIPAGYPEGKSEQKEGAITVDSSMLVHCTGHRLFALIVKGDSMTGRSICEEDWIVADADVVPNVGDVVVALIDGLNTLKTLARQNGRFFLKAENPTHPDWIPIEEIIVQGVVKAVLRRI
ncbi:MAG: transcriptional repressor LexA [Proteobacteria bacterium]|nr:transcriptional repressor LexA [Pseudomonadota bacterium]MBU4470881.1 transcriptional repressor LexA [Pseudomonadota bacterium]MCG2751879.1 transcriptional repressor LexA [Desulfobacteraceae bacterium]